MTARFSATLRKHWGQLSAELRKQWVFAALVGIVWCGDVLLIDDRFGSAGFVLLWASTSMAVLCVVGYSRPVLCGWLASLNLVLNSVLMYAVDAEPRWLGLDFLQPTEHASGVLLLLYAFWKPRLRQSIPVGVALVLSCVAALVIRIWATAEPNYALALGFLQVVLIVGTGLYLRGRRGGTVDTPLRSLFRRQWPTMAALTVLLFGDMAAAVQNLPGGVLAIVGCIGIAVLAVVSPVRPVEASLLAAFILILMSVLMRLFRIPASYEFILGSMPISVVASGMLLVTFATRQAEPRRAVLSNGILVASALFAVVVLPPDGVGRSNYTGALIFGGLLLVASVGTGLYFRARDEERAKSVDAAISHAQQAERMALARELHDVVAHHVTGIVVQAQAAHLVSKENPRASAEALERIAASGTEALTAMRRLVSSMRSAEPVGSSEATEQATMDFQADLEAIVARSNRVLAQHNGPWIDLTVDLFRKVPPEVARSALRVVQESLTNSEKHALDATRIQTSVTGTATHLHVRITDDGTATRAQPVGGSGGYGLVGMRERVELLGGRFNAGPGDHIGWCVDAWLPLDEEEDS